MAENLAIHLIFLRCVCFTAQIIVEIGLDQFDCGFNGRPLVVMRKELSPIGV